LQRMRVEAVRRPRSEICSGNTPCWEAAGWTAWPDGNSGERLPLVCLLLPTSRRGRAAGNKILESFEVEFLPQLAPEQQKINAHLKELRCDRQVPHMPDLKSGRARNEYCWQSKEKQSRHRADQRWPGIANPLKHA